jgi:hypothetical protein
MVDRERRWSMSPWTWSMTFSPRFYFAEAPKLLHIYDLVLGLKENQFPVLKFYVLGPKTSKLHNFLTVIPF